MNWLRLFVVFILFCTSSILFAQNAQNTKNTNDVDLLMNTDFVKKKGKREVTYGFSENPSTIVRYNPVYHVLSGTMWVYQKFISPQLASECRYQPSCSAYSKQLIRDLGIAKGIFCTADRLMRCNRITISGVPPESFDPYDRKIHETTNRYSLK